MSDILIRGMEMPKGCRSCPFYAYDGDMDYYCLISSDNEPCPLVQLPPHGRLIDADALKAMCIAATKDAKPDFIRHEDWLKACAVTTAFCRDIDEAPTIIPADKEVGEDG